MHDLKMKRHTIKHHGRMNQPIDQGNRLATPGRVRQAFILGFKASGLYSRNMMDDLKTRMKQEEKDSYLE